jgi:opacity protein-like surface antigen
MRTVLLLALAFCLAGATAAEAQMRRPAVTPRTWAGAYGLMYTGMGSFYDPGTDSDWVFDDNAFGLGIELLREVASGLQIGADFSLGRPQYERRPRSGQAALAGRATVGTAMASGRIGYGGGGELGFYLSGGIGTVAYYLEDLEKWNSDFALRAGTGLEYRMRPNRGLFLEWGRIWGYHERDGIGGGAAQHSVLKLGLRLGF